MKKMNLEDYKIECFIGGYSANNFWLRSDGNRLLYINPVVPLPYWEEAEIIEPDPETLSRFIQSIKGLGKWRRKYEINVLDGQDWEFLMKGLMLVSKLPDVVHTLITSTMLLKQ